MRSGIPPVSSSDDSNPYAPPKTEIDASFRLSAHGVVPFDLGCILSATWMVFKEQLGSCLGVCWTVLGLVWASQFVQRRLVQGVFPGMDNGFHAFVVQFSVFVIVYVFNVWLSIGQNLALLRLARREPAAFGEIFRGGRFLLTTIVAGVVFVLLLGLIGLVNLIWIPIVVGMIGPGGSVMVLLFAMGIAVALITAVYVAIRFSQFHFMILDRNAGVVDSLRFSWESTRRGVATLILIFVLVFLINFGGLLACFVGILVSAPFTSLMLAVTYLSLTGQPLGWEKLQVAYWDEEFQEGG
jgi:hypothetical protein